MKRFIIATQGFTKADDAEFIAWCRSNGLGWWHRISGFWMLTCRLERPEVTDVEVIRGKLMEISRAGPCLVLDVPEDIAWAAYSHESDGEAFSKWLKTTWVGSRTES